MAILSTGDEVVDVTRSARPISRFATATSVSIEPLSGSWLAGDPVVLGNAPDEKGAELRGYIVRGVDADILVLRAACRG